MDREFVDINEPLNIHLMKPTDSWNHLTNEYTYYTHYDNGALYASPDMGSAMHLNDYNGTTYLSMADDGYYPYNATTYPEYTSSGYWTKEVQSPDTSIPTKEYRSIHTLQNTTVGNLPVYTLQFSDDMQQTMDINTNDENISSQPVMHTEQGTVVSAQQLPFRNVLLHSVFPLPSPSTSESSNSESKYHYLETLSPNNSSQHDYEQPLPSLANFANISEHISERNNNNVHSEAINSTASNSDPPTAPTPPLEPSSSSRSKSSSKSGKSIRPSVVLHSEYQCKICSGYYKTRYGLTQHKKSVHSDYKYRCRTCGKHFPTAEILDEHTVKHSRTDKPWKCKKCPKSYINKSDMIRHLQTHDPSTKPYQCSRCGMRFGRADHRDLHLNSHARQDRKRKRERQFQGVDHDVSAGA
ncbi:zinc finger protein 181-like [Toxorhynchites rutilus septentrionalis]|uniref:zinc finger protein 181-like n=1 Tax=Toxorhynchites rutilus septentrionalis TaxID=329112 RepID=UPI00247A9E27|nr:zinc finger protein 181-like [Toxorhynchites rutilus septentrionalis]XP_055641663.1 zinc finger protein 181-like [Toxorhynchites rutilus septentrionalis]